MRRSQSQKGFTLIELLVVVIIVAVLAAVGIPLLTGNVERARLSEADAGLGTVRTAMRARLAELGSYPTIAAGTLASAANLGISPPVGTRPGDLDGRFFSDASYTVASPRAGTNTFCGNASGAVSAAPRAAQVVALARSMDELGHIHDAANCGGSVIN